jgi:RNA polymerase sigma-70 factor (ECF subfamily)
LTHDETNVIARAKAGDRRAFERLIARWDGEVLNLAYRLTGHREDARDVRQAAFIRAYGALDSFDGRSRFSTWLFRIVINLCRDHVRSSARRARLAPAAPPERDRTGTAEDEADRAELARLVREAVTALPTDEREVLVLRHYHQLRLVEVARVLDIPPTTARARLGRALDGVRGRLAQTEPRICDRGLSHEL